MAAGGVSRDHFAAEGGPDKLPMPYPGMADEAEPEMQVAEEPQVWLALPCLLGDSPDA